jgi:hypothetical protein
MLSSLTGVTRLYMNIGSNVDPVMAPSAKGTATISFEPVVGCSIKPALGLHVIHAAVSDENGFASIGVYNAGGLSSSLAEPAPALSARLDANPAFRKPPKLVPMVAMTSVLGALPPPPLELWFLKTDMQGYDFKALGSAGPRLRRASFLVTEVWVFSRDGGSYAGVRNDYCRDWLPYMLGLGFIPTGLQREQPRPKFQLFNDRNHGKSAAGFIAMARAFCKADELRVKKKREDEIRTDKLEKLANASSRQRHIADESWEADAWWIRNDTTLPLPPGVRAFVAPWLPRCIPGCWSNTNTTTATPASELALAASG